MLRCVRVIVLVGVFVVNAVCTDPLDRPALPCEAATDGQKIFEPLRRGKAAMRQEAVIAKSDPDRPCQENEQEEHRQAGPREKERRGQGADVEGGNTDDDGPIDVLKGNPALTHGLVTLGCHYVHLPLRVPQGSRNGYFAPRGQHSLLLVG